MMLMADNTFKRYELKYMLDREQYEQIMSEMIRYMQPDRFAHSQIINIYFDTPSHRLIRDSIEKAGLQREAQAQKLWSPG